MAGLAQRGHEIRVLTTRKERGMTPAPVEVPFPVIRRLHWSGRKMQWAERLTCHRLTNWLGVGIVFLRQIRWDVQDLKLIEKHIKEFNPDLIYLGHIMPLTREMLPFLARQSIPMVLDDGGITALTCYQERGLWRRFQSEYEPSLSFLRGLKNVFIKTVGWLSGGRLRLEWVWPEALDVFFNSQLNLGNFEAGHVPARRKAVIHSGVDTQQFSFERSKPFGNPLTILLPGRIEPQKGQLDAVALADTLKQSGIDCQVMVVGDIWKQDYLDRVEAEIHAQQLDDQVRILPMQDIPSLVRLYQQADICLFPSYHRTGFSRVPLEGMACGSMVISYGNEGSDEIIRHGETGFVIPQGGVAEAASLLQSLIVEPLRVGGIIEAARGFIEANHSTECYIDQIASYLGLR